MPENVAYETARCELYLAERHVLKTARALLTKPNAVEAASDLIAAVAGLTEAEQRFTLNPPKRYVVREGLTRGKGFYLSKLAKDNALIVAAWTQTHRRRAVFDNYEDAFDAAALYGARVVRIKKVPRGRKAV